VKTDNQPPALTDNPPPTPPVFGGWWKKWLWSTFFALVAGLVAALVSVVSMLTLRLVAGIPTPVELFGDFILKHLYVYTFVNMEIHFQPNPKLTPLGLTLLAMIALGAVLGPLYALLVRLPVPVAGQRPEQREWQVMVLLGIVMASLGTVLFWDEIRQNFLGLPIFWASLVTALGMLLDFVLYALVLGWSYRFLLPKQLVESGQETARGRRQLLARTGVAVLGVGAAAGTLGLVRGYLDRYSSYDGMETWTIGGHTAPITPINEHYVVTQNPIDPTVSTDVWRLEVTGLVNSSGTYTYEEFTSLPSISRAVTLECIANGIGGHLISTAIWQGVTFRSLLEKHGGAQTSAKYVVFSSIDGYTVSQPLEEVLAVDTLLAFQMDGVKLPARHGYPIRVLIPGHYGEENPKWLTRIELSEQFVGGLYSDQGWYNGELHTISRIDRPLGRIPLASTVEVAGFSFAGSRGIEKVEISTDDGQSWTDAQLTPPLSQDAWVFWTYEWHPGARGAYTLVARATDGTGEVQTSQQQGTVPNGATGYHKVPVTLA
jgi:DMSO/TMAO reductase YedYZ molybdopterin-dependent catalytic subunit